MEASNKNNIFKFLIIGVVIVVSILFIGRYILKEMQKRSKASSSAVALVFDPTSATAANGADFTETVKVGANSTFANITGYTLKITFDKTAVAVKTIEYKLGVVSLGLGDKDNISTINSRTPGYIYLQGEIQAADGGPITAGTEVVKITFTSLGSGSSNINIDKSSVAFYKKDMTTYIISALPLDSTGDIILPVSGAAGGATNTPTPTTGATGPTTNFNLKIRLAGILTMPPAQFNPIKVKVSLIGPAAAGQTNIQSAVANFTPSEATDLAGVKKIVWSGSVAFTNVAPGVGYMFLIKGPMHLQKKICDEVPSDGGIPGSYNCKVGSSITIPSGQTAISYDFSDIYQMAGDFPQQDGVSDAYDYSQAFNNKGQVNPDVDCAMEGGPLSSRCYSLLMQSRAHKFDETP